MNTLLLSVADTQRVLGVGKTKVFDLIKRGHLQTVKIGRSTRIKASSVRAIAGERAVPVDGVSAGA